MLLTKKESTEDMLVRVLSGQEKNAKELHRLLEKESTKTITIQALYRAINRLVAEGVLIKKGNFFTVSKEWIQNLINYFETQSSMELSEGEQISYSFSSLSTLDAYWKHTVTQLQKTLKDCPILFYNRHIVWLHLVDRKESQKKFLESFDNEKKYAGFVVGGNTKIDQESKKMFSRKYLQVELRNVPSVSQDSLTVYGDYVIGVKFKKKTTEFVEQLYKESESIEELEQGLEKSLEGKLSVQLIIERNITKAQKVRATLSKNFYFPKETKDKWGL